MATQGRQPPRKPERWHAFARRGDAVR